MKIEVPSVSLFSAVRRQPVAMKSAAQRRRHIRHGVVLLVVMVTVAILFVWTRIQVIQFGYEVSRLRKEIIDLAEQKGRLTAQVASLKDPERLEDIARRHFGMRLPLADEIVFVDNEVNQY